MNHVIETVGAWGVRTTPWDRARRSTPKPGDIVEFSDELRKYPISHLRCRIAGIDRHTRMASIVDGMGSAFLFEDGSVSISGGPFFSVPLETLSPTIICHDSLFWNWGDNSPGAAQGVEYRISRPVFIATRHPDSYTIRYATSEQTARVKDAYSRDPIPSDARLVRSWESHDGLKGFLFDIMSP